jgi:hypothetical protein
MKKITKIRKGYPMNSCIREVFTCFFIVISILLLACGASHKMIDDIIYVDENFSYNNLKKNGLIVGGMCFDVIEISREDRLEYSSTFSNVLIEKLKDVSMIQITNPMQLIDKMGQTSYFNMMKDYDHQKALSRLWADTLEVILPDVQYILFAYLVNENIVDESYDRYVESDEGEELETEYKKTYFITVEFHLYDLFRKELVRENSIFNKAQRTESRTTQTGCFESCMNSLFQHLLFGEPAEISRDEVFVKIVEKFAEDISKS